MERLKNYCVDNEYQIIAYTLLLVHSVLEVLYILAGCKSFSIINLECIAIYLLVATCQKKMSLQLSFWIIYAQVTIFSIIAVVFFGDSCYYSIELAPMIPFICQWDYNNKYVLHCKSKKNMSYIRPVLCVFIIYVVEKVIDWEGLCFDVFIPEIYSTLIFGMNLVIMMIAILFGSVIWMSIVSNTANKLEVMLDQTHYMANHDELTGLSNRKSLNQYIKTLESEKKNYCILIGDIDHFKNVNDDNGHSCGDYVLREISALLRKMFRNEDKIYRWGGEELVIILPDVNIGIATKRAEQVRAAIENNTFDYKNTQLKITMSIGVAESHSRDFNTVVNEADKRLYYAKNHGRNCVIGNEV